MRGILGRSTSKSGLNTRQLTFFFSTAFMTAFSRADKTDRPVLTSMNTISISSTEALSPLKAIRSIRRAKKTNVFGVEIEAWKVWHDVLSHLALVTAELRCMASGLISCSCSCFHRSICMRASAAASCFSCVSSACLSSLRHRLIPHLNSARHCDAQVDASCGRKHKQAEK